MISIRKIVKSAGFYPITGLYVADAAVILLLTTNGNINVTTALLVIGILSVIAILFAAWRELRAVHMLVNSQRTELLHRIDVLTDLLNDAGAPIPPEGDKEHDARTELQRRRNETNQHE